MDLILQVFYSVFSGILLSAAIPNEFFKLGYPAISLFAIIPFYIAFRKVRNYKWAYLLMGIQTTVTHFISSFWLAFKDFAVMTYGGSAFGTFFISGFSGLFLFIPYSTQKYKNKLNEHSLSKTFFDTAAFRIIYFTAVYTLYEWIKSNGFFGYPWGTVSSAVYKWNYLKQLASITGTYGITFIIVMFNAILAEILMSCSIKDFFNDKEKLFSIRNSLCTFGIFLILILIHGFYQTNKTRIPVKYLSTVIVQQNSDPWKESSDEQSILNSEELTLKEIENLETQGKKADLVVWSECTMKYLFPNFYDYYGTYPVAFPFHYFVRTIETPIIIGCPYAEDYQNKDYSNSTVLIDKDANLRGHYGKNHLVPFAESVPFRELPLLRKLLSPVLGQNLGWVPGKTYTFYEVPCSLNPDNPGTYTNTINLLNYYGKTDVNSVPTVKICTPICFDDAFTDIMRPLFWNGAELFVNLTDDSWSQTDSAEYQHFVIASYKAIEYRTTLVRSTNAGYSAVITPSGKIIADAPLFEKASFSCDVPVYERTITTYALYGDWLPFVIAVLLSAYAVYIFFAFVLENSSFPVFFKKEILNFKNSQ